MLKKYSLIVVTLLLLISVSGSLYAEGQSPFKAEDVFKIKSCRQAEISPDGKYIAYTVSRSRTPGDKPGGSYTELYVMSLADRSSKLFIGGKTSVWSIKWRPDGKAITFLTRRGKGGSQVWEIALAGGEAVQLTRSVNGVLSYEWHPSGNKIAYTAFTPKSKREKTLRKKGYGFIFFEENLKHRNLYLYDIKAGKTEQLTKGRTVWSFVFNKKGDAVAVGASKLNLIDHKYMFQKVYVLSLKDRKIRKVSKNEGKLGNFVFSPDGKKLAYTASIDLKDHAVSQIYVTDLKSGEVVNKTIKDFRGHVTRAYWKDNKTVAYIAGEGVWPTYSTVGLKSAPLKRKVVLNSKSNGATFRSLSFTKDGKTAAYVGSKSTSPAEIWLWKVGKKPVMLKSINPWIAERKLGVQKVVNFKARDGMMVEGLLILPSDYVKGKKYPLVVIVHGGPESHYTNRWVTRYSEPGQVLAGKGYAVYYPNYRASTGYGVKFALEGYEDPAGKEFDDLADGIEYLIKEGIADRERVGLGGGSYGGYASAWFATYYTKYVRAVCMFVGISNIISKRGTTDIAYEELYVHSGQPLEKMWDLNLKRSPVYWAHQSKTATLIMGGAADTRVHPAQSLELHRRMKMNNHPAVRLVQYPGEGHGNRKQPGQIDLLYRSLDWYDWYVRDKKPLDGKMPPLDISDKYGLKLK